VLTRPKVKIPANSWRWIVRS